MSKLVGLDQQVEGGTRVQSRTALNFSSVAVGAWVNVVHGEPDVGLHHDVAAWTSRTMVCSAT